MNIIPGEYYHSIYIVIVFVLCWVQANKFSAYPNSSYLVYNSFDTRRRAINWCVIFAFFVGFRPICEYFTDMTGYANGYELGCFDVDPDAIRQEPIWKKLQSFCYSIGLPVTGWFAVVASIAITMHYKACRNWFGNNIYPAILFMCTGFYYWTNVTGIIRSGLASAIAIYAMSIFMKSEKCSKIMALFIMYVALNIHKSSALISVCFFASYYLIKDIRWGIGFWVFCCIGSLLAGGYFEALFASMGFDDRMSSMTTDVDYSGFAHSGFRWDFLIYSTVPIILGLYVTKKNDNNRIYSILLNTYILCNAFWVLVIRAQFSDRFAGLSWIIYPIVIAYPFLKMEVWHNQQKKARWALLLHVGFIVGMNLIYYELLKC